MNNLKYLFQKTIENFSSIALYLLSILFNMLVIILIWRFLKSSYDDTYFFILFKKHPLMQLILLNVITYIFGIFIPTYVYMKLKKIKIKFSLSLRNISISILLGFFLQPLLLPIAGIINSIIGTNNFTTFSAPFKGINPVIFALLISIFPAIIEEIVFRGIVFTKLSEKLSIRWSIITSAIIFGIYHLNIAQLFYASIVGIAFALVYNKSKSLLNTIIIHFVINFSQGIMMILTLNMPTYEAEETINTVPQLNLVISLLIVGIIFYIIFLPLCIFLYNLYIPEKSDTSSVNIK